jgi:hypothetical protein
MSTCIGRLICPVMGISVFITPVARPRPTTGAAGERFPDPPTPARWNVSSSLRGFHDY